MRDCAQIVHLVLEAQFNFDKVDVVGVVTCKQQFVDIENKDHKNIIVLQVVNVGIRNTLQPQFVEEKIIGFFVPNKARRWNG